MPITDEQVSAALDTWWMLCGITVINEAERDYTSTKMRRCLEGFERDGHSGDEVVAMLRKLDEQMNDTIAAAAR